MTVTATDGLPAGLPAERAAELRSIVDELVAARDGGPPVRRRRWLDRELGAWVKGRLVRAVSEERPVVGFKVSLTEAWGALFAGDQLPSGSTVQLDAMNDPLVETEAIFHLEDTVTADMSVDDVLARVRVGAGIEIADCRWEGWGPTERGFKFAPEEPGGEPRFPSKGMLDADNGFARNVVLAPGTVPGTALDWPSVRVDCRRDGEVIASGTLEHVFGHPARAVTLLAGKLAEHGLSLQAGQFVSTGNPYPDLLTVPRGAPSVFACDIHGLGTAEVTFA